MGFPKRSKVAKPADTQLRRRAVKIITQSIVFETVYPTQVLEGRCNFYRRWRSWREIRQTCTLAPTENRLCHRHRYRHASGDDVRRTMPAARRCRSKNPRSLQTSVRGGIPAAAARKAARKRQPPVSGGLQASRCKDSRFSSNGAACRGTLRPTAHRNRTCPLNPVLPVPARSRSCRGHRMCRVCRCPTR